MFSAFLFYTIEHQFKRLAHMYMQCVYTPYSLD